MCKCLLVIVAPGWLDAAMTRDFEDDIVHDEDAICGWGPDDFDDELLGRSRRKLVSQTVCKSTKRRTQKTLANSNSGAELPTLGKLPEQQHRPRLADPSTEKQTGGTNQFPNESHKVASSLGNQPSVHRKSKRKQTHETLKSHHDDIPKPSPRTTSILHVEENAAIAARGRQRRMKVVASAMAANIPRKSGMASVVSAFFDNISDDDQEEPEVAYRQRSDEWLPSSAPQNQLVKLPHVAEPSTAPAGPTEAAKKIHPPLPLPLLSTNPNCGSNETRLPGRDEPVSKAPRRRRYRQQKTSLLPSRDVSDIWESNFHPSQRRCHSPSKDQVSSSDASTTGVTSPFAGTVRVCTVPRQILDPALRAKELLPSIHQPNKGLFSAITTEVSNFSHGNNSKLREEEDSGEGDDESWIYDDPEVIAKSMAGLIQALSTFAVGGKDSKASKGGKSKKRRAKAQQLQFSQNILVSPPSPGEINASLNRANIREGHREPEPNIKRRKHRKLCIKPNDDSNHSTVNQVR